MSQLSVVIITKNEANNIKRCLESVKWADEIIVVDSGSTDATLSICEQYHAHTFSNEWLGYGPQKNLALEKAQYPWVLSLDADEQVSTVLRGKIQTILENESAYAAYAIKRPVMFFGQQIKHACGADQTVRLFKRGHAKFSDDIVHETVLVEGKVGHIEQPIYHYSFESIAMIIAKMNKYTDLVSQQRIAKHQKSSLFKAITHAAWMFFRVYILKAGFLDGRAGFVLAVGFAEGAYYRYVKMLYPSPPPQSDI